MKKILIIICCAFAVLSASAQDKKLTLNAGFLFPNTLNAMIGYEHPLSYGNAVEIYGEAGNHWQEPTCCRFWKGYYWDGGLVYKHRLVRYKNGMLRFPLHRNSEPPRRSSFSDWKPALNTAMSFRTVGSSR